MTDKNNYHICYIKEIKNIQSKSSYYTSKFRSIMEKFRLDEIY